MCVLSLVIGAHTLVIHFLFISWLPKGPLSPGSPPLTSIMDFSGCQSWPVCRSEGREGGGGEKEDEGGEGRAKSKREKRRGEGEEGREGRRTGRKKQSCLCAFVCGPRLVLPS